MATKPETIDFLIEQVGALGHVAYRKMFGEYALYLDEKVVALICDNQLYIKPTAIADQFADGVEMAPPYPGAKDYYWVSEDRWEETEWLCDWIRKTADSLPLPKPKAPKKAKKPTSHLKPVKPHKRP